MWIFGSSNKELKEENKRIEESFDTIEDDNLKLEAKITKLKEENNKLKDNMWLCKNKDERKDFIITWHELARIFTSKETDKIVSTSIEDALNTFIQSHSNMMDYIRIESIKVEKHIANEKDDKIQEMKEKIDNLNKEIENLKHKNAESSRWAETCKKINYEKLAKAHRENNELKDIIKKLMLTINNF